MKKLMFLLLSVILLCVTVSAAPEYYPTYIEQKTEDGVQLICKTFEVPADVSPDDLTEPNLTQNGLEYGLRDVLRRSNPVVVECKTVSQSVTVEAASDKPDEIRKLLNPSLPYDENGFIGELSLDEGSITTETAKTEGYSYTVSDTREYPGLIRNDPALLPKTVQKSGVTLNLCNVQWSGGENEPNPVSYSATVTYKGSASGSKPSGFSVSATYSGEVSKTTPGNVVYTLIYAAKPPVIELETTNWSVIWLIAGCSVAVAIIVVAAIFLLRWRRKKKLLATAEPTLELQESGRRPMAMSHISIGGNEDESN